MFKMKQNRRILRKFIENYYGYYHLFCYWNDESINDIELKGKKQ